MAATRWVSPGGLIAVALAAAPAPAQCTAPANWFPHAQTPAPAFATPGDPCAFHRWSWQTFLWLTQTVDGQLRFVKEMYSQDVLFEMKTYGRRLPTFAEVIRAQKRLKLRPRDAKPQQVRGGEGINQAGDHGMLVDQRHHAVYYAIHVNQTYYDFVRTNHYNEPDILANAPATAQFPVGSLQIKSAWRIIESDETEGGLYQTTADLERLKYKDGKVVVDPDNVDSRTVGLVGLHIAGIVEGHPEFVWATFEPQGNAPLLPPTMAISSPGPVSAAGARFYAAGTAARDCNQSNGGKVTLDVSKQTLDPVTQVFRQVAWGGGDESLIRALNDSVHRQLGADLAAGYDLIGALWVRDGSLLPDTVPGAPDRWAGSPRLANTTMETFRQPFGNCFHCHDTRGYSDAGYAFPPMNLNVSHALRRTYITNQIFQKTQQPTPQAPKK